MKAKFVYKGGKGSGNFGHSGIPGHQGGSKGTGGASGGYDHQYRPANKILDDSIRDMHISEEASLVGKLKWDRQGDFATTEVGGYKLTAKREYDTALPDLYGYRAVHMGTNKEQFYGSIRGKLEDAISKAEENIVYYVE